jgi:hypothetical protein
MHRNGRIPPVTERRAGAQCSAAPAAGEPMNATAAVAAPPFERQRSAEEAVAARRTVPLPLGVDCGGGAAELTVRLAANVKPQASPESCTGSAPLIPKFASVHAESGGEPSEIETGGTEGEAN